MMKTWNLSLVIGTFLLTLFGTFLTRSGILDSVHAFTEGVIGPLFLGFIAFWAIASLALIAWRSDRLHAPGSLEGVVSRESAFIMNNLLFAAFTFTVLLGTTFPLIIEAVNGQRISVGPPYFNMVTAPLGLALLFLMGVGPALPWRRTSADNLKRTFWLPVAIGLAVALLAWVAGIRRVYPLVTFAFAGFVMTTIFEEFRKGVSARRRISGAGPVRALGQLLVRSHRRYGGYIVHTGIVVIVVALSISAAWRFEREATLDIGERLELGGYGVQLERVWGDQEPQRFVVGGTFSIWDGERQIGTMTPRMNFYPSSQQPIATPAVRSNPKEDLYLTLMAFDNQQGTYATVRAIVNPGVPWLWVGGMIIAIGAVLSILPGPRRSRAVTVMTLDEPTGEAEPAEEELEAVPA